MRRALATLLALTASLAAAGDAAAAPRAYDYAAPVQATSPWPEMRRDTRNTGAGAFRASYGGARPWSFHTGRGIFSTPVIAGDGTVYVGSADGFFYALGPGGKLRWKFKTGGIIDAAAAIGRYDHKRHVLPITIGSGDETLYQLNASTRRMSRAKRILWRYRTDLAPATGQLVNWWEGNVAYGPDGSLYAGNTGGGTYSFNARTGQRRWVVQRGNSVWTTPAFDSAGNSYWGSVDLHAFSLDPLGSQRWEVGAAGYFTSSPALGSDGTVYTASFDGRVYALDPATGVPKWSFPTGDHIYSSPALENDAAGTTRAIFIGSTDGSVYALRPDGSEIWRYDTGDPVRSSPVLGKAPKGDGRIVYVGSSNGKLYAFNAATGSRRWSFDTTPKDPVLADRNDLNGSPALGKAGVYIGGEHGSVWFVPYDFCLHRSSPRCDRSPGQELGGDLDKLFFVTPGGTTRDTPPPVLSTATVLGTRLVVRKGGVTQDAQILGVPSSDSLVSADPPFPFRTQLSGDGHYLFIRPDGLLDPGTKYSVRVHGGWATAADAGSFDRTFSFRTDPRGGKLALGGGKGRVGALTISRLALPLPPLLPSVNQIGFDSYDLIAGTLMKTKPDANGAGRVLMWVIEGRRNNAGTVFAKPGGNFAFPLTGTYRGDQIALDGTGLNLQFSFGPVPLRNIDFRGRLEGDGSFAPGASVFGQVSCSEVPNYSVYLYVAGVCNPNGTLAASGTFVSDRYSAKGDANRRPSGVSAGAVTLERPTPDAPGSVDAQLRIAKGGSYPAKRHLASVLLVDTATGAPVGIDYRADSRQLRDSEGNVSGVHLTIPAGTQLPAALSAYVIADVYPLAERPLG